MEKVLLIDGDIVAYQAASASEHPIQWDDDTWTLHSFESETCQKADEIIDSLMEQSECKKKMVFLSGKKVFRKEIDTEYKANRTDKRKPVCLPAVRAHLKKKHRAKFMEHLEADDLLGIYATIDPDKYIIWSPDKDLRQIAGQHLIDGKVVKIEKDVAMKNFYKQILTGDVADNYKGVRGIGEVTAEKLLTPKDGVEADENWLWAQVTNAYKKAKMSEEDAIRTARLAHILTVDTMNTLWSPPMAQIDIIEFSSPTNMKIHKNAGGLLDAFDLGD